MPWAEDGRWVRDPTVQRGMEVLGAAVRRQRERRGMTQRDLQRRNGVHQTTISRFENGRRCGLRLSRFALVVYALGGLDFGSPVAAALLEPDGLSPNPIVARRQLDALELAVAGIRERVRALEASWWSSRS